MDQVLIHDKSSKSSVYRITLFFLFFSVISTAQIIKDTISQKNIKDTCVLQKKKKRSIVYIFKNDTLEQKFELISKTSNKKSGSICFKYIVTNKHRVREISIEGKAECRNLDLSETDEDFENDDVGYGSTPYFYCDKNYSFAVRMGIGSNDDKIQIFGEMTAKNPYLSINSIGILRKKK